jgi:hypothetical protein
MMRDLKDFGKPSGAPVPFSDKLSALVAFEMSAAHGDPDRMAEVLERLLFSASFTISIMARGDAKTTENLITGAEAYLAEGAVGYARFGAFMNKARP